MKARNINAENKAQRVKRGNGKPQHRLPVLKILRCKRGESIMEAVVSMLILGMLMTTVVSIIRFSLFLTGNTLDNASRAQERFNALIHETYDGTVVTLTFATGSSSPFDISAEHEVTQSVDEEAAFKPSTAPDGG
jgi:hypothetical protein